MHETPLGDGLPRLMPEKLALYLTAPVVCDDRRFRRGIVRGSIDASEPFPRVLCILLSASQLHESCVAWSEAFTATELRLIRCCVFPECRAPSFAELMQSHDLSTVIAWADAQWLGEVIQANRLVTHFQPIVYSRRPGDVFGYECLLRGQDLSGTLIPPNRLYAAARASGLLGPLDRAARLTAIETASRRGLSTRVFINVNPRSIEDPVRCLESTLQAVLASAIEPGRFIFEVVESEEIVDRGRLLEMLARYRDVGCGVALDDLGAGYSSLSLLTSLRPDYVKLDLKLMQNVDKDPFKSAVAAKILELAKELGIRTVVEGVETVGQWQWATRYGADYAQGFLFARPAPQPPVSRFRDGSVALPWDDESLAAPGALAVCETGLTS
jgi:EAL domain-containing protein (putative c-di-GMP-specific phosphodiesterase class I)